MKLLAIAVLATAFVMASPSSSGLLSPAAADILVIDAKPASKTKAAKPATKHTKHAAHAAHASNKGKKHRKVASAK